MEIYKEFQKRGDRRKVTTVEQKLLVEIAHGTQEVKSIGLKKPRKVQNLALIAQNIKTPGIGHRINRK